MPRTFRPADAQVTLFQALLAAGRTYGRSRQILEDADRKPLTYGQITLASLVLGRKIAALTARGDAVGVLLPNAAGVVITLFALNAYGRVAAFLNFTAGPKNLRSALETARVRVVLTSRRFIEAAKLEDLVAHLAATEIGGEKTTVVYLEDIRRNITKFDKVRGALAGLLAGPAHRHHALPPGSPAVILFTSGTEGVPKGVALTSVNLVSNAFQVHAHAGDMLSDADIFFNPLPLFHSFGLSAGTLTPILNGIKTVLYPSPLHYKQVPKLIGETKATILLATDTFLNGYARAAEARDLSSVRYVVAGAERVKESTRALWAKYGTVLLEGYGATECAPVVACNVPPTNRPGTVGRTLPGVETRLDPVPGIHDGGRLVVRGPNVMAGYILHDRPGQLIPTPDGWHDTGDIVSIDQDGFITIKGRAKRFAKIGGEMISLAAVESMVASLWPDANHVVVSIPDARKGEQLVLVTDKPDADKDALLQRAQADGFAELWIPRALLVVESIPVLGSGKTDFVAATTLVEKTRALL
jgi:acyl-[acyl-carrier-protein]-phospholipid O-acyltransferase/long-chain-fatty-acid--[acyl-carrier-protein] ligase